MLEIDKVTLVRLIEEKRPERVLVSCPSGVLVECIEFVSSLAKEYGFEVIFSGEPCYGVCDLTENDAMMLDVDLTVHIGHSASSNTIGRSTYLIEAHDDIDIIPALESALNMNLIRYKRLGLCSIGPHLHKLKEAKSFLESKCFEVIIGDEVPPLKMGQIFGCNFSTCEKIASKVDAFIFVGSSRFHAIGLYNNLEKPVIMVDPYTKETVFIEKEALAVKKRLIFNFYKAVDAQNIGIIVGLKEGQYRIGDAFHLYKELNSIGRNTIMIAMREITNDKLNEFRNIDAFIETACPRIGEDYFDKPVVSLEYGHKLLEYLRKGSSHKR
ncbi:MAG: diphthamide biosynthesis enzyme Dph2 [Nitrososphaeria archaeon]